MNVRGHTDRISVELTMWGSLRLAPITYKTASCPLCIGGSLRLAYSYALHHFDLPYMSLLGVLQSESTVLNTLFGEELTEF